TLLPSVKLLRDRLVINANAGMQKNNLDNQKSSSSRRFVASGNVSFTLSSGWSFIGSYSNFTSFTRVKPITEPGLTVKTDTLDVYQITKNASFSVQRSYGGKIIKHTILLSGNYQASSQL